MSYYNEFLDELCSPHVNWLLIQSDLNLSLCGTWLYRSANKVNVCSTVVSIVSEKEPRFRDWLGSAYITKKLGHEFQRREIHQPGLGLISTRPEDFTTFTSVWPTAWPARPLPSSSSSTGTVILFLGVLRIKLKIDLLLFLFMYQTNFHLFSAVCSRTLSTFGSQNVN